MDSLHIPDGYTADEWAGIVAASDVLDFNDAPAPARRGPIQAKRDGKCYVYFIGGDGTPIKIGLSNAPYERLAALQTAHWLPLEIYALTEGGLALEQQYHAKFASVRLAGEWFERAPEVLREIKRIDDERPHVMEANEWDIALGFAPAKMIRRYTDDRPDNVCLRAEIERLSA